MSSIYREQEYVERCHCNEPATYACAACGRARCNRHLERRLCNRCSQAITREVEQRSGRRWFTSGATGVGTALTMLVALGPGGALIGLPIGIGAYFLTRIWQRAALVQKMGPALSASKGELAAPPTEPEFPDAPPMRYY